MDMTAALAGGEQLALPGGDSKYGLQGAQAAAPASLNVFAGQAWQPLGVRTVPALQGAAQAAAEALPARLVVPTGHAAQDRPLEAL